MHRLRDQISEYRDKQITHFRNPRALFPTYITADDQTQIGISTLDPKPTDTSSQSPLLSEIGALLNEYVQSFMRLITLNRHLSRYSEEGG